MDTQIITSKHRSSYKRYLFSLFLITLLGVGVFLNLDLVKQSFLFSEDVKSEVLQFAKDISTPGGLVSKIESKNAFLTEAGVFEFTNKARVENSLGAFVLDDGLSRIAKERLDDMFRYQYFEHVSPTGSSASKVAEDFKYQFISIGENIALGNFENDQVLVEAWMNSPGHRANILSSKFTALGVAVGKGNYEGRTVWIGVQIFSRPLSACPQIDSSIRSKIRVEEDNLENLHQELERVKNDLDVARKAKDEEEYNRLVSIYNDLARNINEKSGEVKKMVDEYNAQVRAFNDCIE